MIPEGWSAKAVGEICELVNGRGFKPHEWKAIGLPIIRIQNLNGSTDFNYYEGKYDPKIEVEHGQLLFAWSGSRGTSFGAHIWRGPKALLNYHTWKVVAAESYSSDFLHCLFQHLTRRIESSAHGAAALVHTQKGEMERFPVIVPPYVEQTRIAERMRVWDRAIETVEALIANARAQKQALMQQLLSGKQRLPGFSDPWGWAAFADVFSRVKTKNAEGNTNVLTISAQHGLISQVEYFNKTVASDDVRGYTLLQRGDFAYNKSYSDGYPMGAIKPLDRYDSGIVSSLYICFRLTKRGFDHDFFRHYFEAGLFNREIAAIAQEGARNHGLLNVSVIEFFETSLHLPKRDEQVAIAKVINAAEAEEKAYQTQLTALRQEKAALMQQLLTGKRRVKLPDREVD